MDPIQIHVLYLIMLHFIQVSLFYEKSQAYGSIQIVSFHVSVATTSSILSGYTQFLKLISTLPQKIVNSLISNYH